jgi:glycosyltransferase involved in cell wall biosynthesis
MVFIANSLHKNGSYTVAINAAEPVCEEVLTNRSRSRCLFERLLGIDLKITEFLVADFSPVNFLNCKGLIQCMPNRKQILMIVYFFPPLGGAGAQRSLKFAKYLPSFGWHPIILGVKNPDAYYGTDPHLLNELPESLQVMRANMFRAAWFYQILNPLRLRKVDKFISDYILIPDDKLGWIPFAYLKALNIIKRNDIKAIFTTSSPYSSHLIGDLIKKKTAIPWIADFRDEWSQNPGLSIPTKLHRRLHLGLEGVVVRNADKIIAVNSHIKSLLSKNLESKYTEKIRIITNGFDDDDFSQIGSDATDLNDTNKFILTFAGLFYGAISPDNLLKSLNALIESNVISEKEITIRFIGGNTSRDLLEKDPHQICRFIGYKSHRECIDYLGRSTALLLLLGKGSRSGVDEIIPSKTYEYIATRKPILALVPDTGAAAKLIRASKSGIVINPDDGAGIKEAFLGLYTQWKEKDLKHSPCLEKINKFRRKQLTGQFAEIIDSLC